MALKRSDSTTENIMRIALVTGLLLLIPLLAMQFTNEVNWTLGDFIIMGILIFGIGLTYELVTRKISNSGHKTIIAAVLAMTFFLIWAELAVGIFGTPFAGS